MTATQQLQAEQQGFKKPSYNDGLIEVVGFRSGYHAGAVLFKTMSCVRIAQAAGARVRASGLGPDDDEGSVVYMQLDGEPWEQDVPNGEAYIEVRGRHFDPDLVAKQQCAHAQSAANHWILPHASKMRRDKSLSDECRQHWTCLVQQLTRVPCADVLHECRAVKHAHGARRGALTALP